jgi:hypothetical protein
MPWQIPSKKNKSIINYVLIILAFALLVFVIYLFFKFKINAIEKGSTSAYQTTQDHFKKKIIPDN